jgi:hypothetical protein
LHPDAVFDDVQRLFRRFAQHPAGDRFKPLESANIRIRSLVDARTAGHPLQRAKDRLPPFFRAGGGQLQDDGVAVAIGDQAGQAVGLAMDEPQALLALQLRRQRRRSTAA